MYGIKKWPSIICILKNKWGRGVNSLMNSIIDVQISHIF